jgi:hypothetical protein
MGRNSGGRLFEQGIHPERASQRQYSHRQCRPRPLDVDIWWSRIRERTRARGCLPLEKGVLLLAGRAGKSAKTEKGKHGSLEPVGSQSHVCQPNGEPEVTCGSGGKAMSGELRVVRKIKMARKVAAAQTTTAGRPTR